MKILIAEDEIPQARLLGSLLRIWGYDPLIVHDGQAALRALEAPDAPRLALLDWGLPDLDGIEVCQEIRKETSRPYTYLILLTGRGGQHEKIAGLEAGADDFLAKPVDEAELKARLNTGRRIISLQKQLLAVQARLEEQATRDSLTGVWNRAAILEILDRELARAGREKRPVAILLADLDHFKQINDTYGHLAGDDVLQQAARRMHAELRPYDGLGRYGGEEFLAVLPGCDEPATLRLAERLREAVAHEPLSPTGPLVTVSLGAVCWRGERGDVVEVLRLADEALYRAKNAGRNRTIMAQITPSRTATVLESCSTTGEQTM
jgi:two-component system, cell cycle response regulator